MKLKVEKKLLKHCKLKLDKTKVALSAKEKTAAERKEQQLIDF